MQQATVFCSGTPLWPPDSSLTHFHQGRRSEIFGGGSSGKTKYVEDVKIVERLHLCSTLQNMI